MANGGDWHSWVHSGQITPKRTRKKPKSRGKRKPYPKFMELPAAQQASHDPDMHIVVECLQHEQTNAAIARKAGLSASTIASWRRYRTRRPQHYTMQKALRAFGYEFVTRRISKEDRKK